MPTPVTLQDGLRRVSELMDSLPQNEIMGRYNVPAPVHRALRGAAERTGVGFEVLAAKAAIESGFQPAAQAGTSSARGLFQFIDQTWLSVVQQHGAAHGLAEEAAQITRGAGGRLGLSDPAMRERILALRDNPEISARMGAEHLKDISDRLATTTGSRPDVGGLYLGHFLGTAGAGKLLRAAAEDPGQSAAALLPEAARANATLFRGADGKPLSAAQFIDNIRGKVSKVYDQLGLQAPTGPVAFGPVGAEAKPGEAIASSEPFWWGSGAPARVAHAPERMMASALVEVFNRMGRGQAAQDAGAGNGNALPAPLLEALREPGLPPAAQAARQAYGGA